MRLFVACPLGKNILKKLERLHDNLKDQIGVEKIKWIRPENIHITLKFLGEVEIKKNIFVLKNGIRRAISSFNPYEIEIKDGGFFPSSGRPSVIWIGCCDTSGNTKHIRNNIETELSNAGFSREKRPFIPHLTIGRVKYSRGTRCIADKLLKMDISLGKMKIGQVNLYESRLTSAGSEYSIVEEFKL